MSDQEWPSSAEGNDGGSTPPPPPPPPAPGGGGPPMPGAGGGEIEPRSGLPYADFGKRAVALIIDWAVFVVLVIVLLIVSAIFGAISDVLGFIVSLIGYLAIFVAALAYFILGEGGPLGQTLGKHMMEIKVVGETTAPIGAAKAFLRWIGRILDSIVCGIPIGYLWPLFDDQNRCWHDMVADTRVVQVQLPDKSPQYWLANFRG